MKSEGKTVISKKNPIFKGMGLCDPHGVVYDDTLYLFLGHDTKPKFPEYLIDDWEIFKTNDGITFEHTDTIYPDETYSEQKHACWATHGAERNGQYYFYFSIGNKSIGVMKSAHPGRGYKDVLKRPLLEKNQTPTLSYDPHVFIDDDENQTPYIIFGAPKWAYGDLADGYYIARLKENMVELDETPRKIMLNHPGDDKAALHKFNGIYYLSWASFYAISDNVYGPYTYVGNVNASRDHGSFFFWNNQWFCSFTVFDPYYHYRSSGLTYVFYKNNNEMATDSLINEYGVGRYDARWHRISASWYMKASRYLVKESPNGGFEVSGMSDHDFITFPHIHHIPKKAAVHVLYANQTGTDAVLEIHRNHADGTLLGSANLGKSPFYDVGAYSFASIPLKENAKEESLCFVIRGKDADVILYQFSITKTI